MELISKQAAIAEIRKDIMGGLNFEGILSRMPSVEAEPVRHGKWFISGQDIVCSGCGNTTLKNHRGEDILSPYCMFCGAKMDNVSIPRYDT